MVQRPSKYEAGPQKCFNSLQIEGNWGCYLGTQPIGGGGGGGETEDGTTHTHIYICICDYHYIFVCYDNHYIIILGNKTTITIWGVPKMGVPLNHPF